MQHGTHTDLASDNFTTQHRSASMAQKIKQALSGMLPNLAAGTAIEIGGDSTQTVYEREVLPIMQQQADLWPADVQTLEAFEHYAGLVQSRAFHMLTENWITGSAQEGMSSTNKCNTTHVLYSTCHCLSGSQPT